MVWPSKRAWHAVAARLYHSAAMSAGAEDEGAACAAASVTEASGAELAAAGVPAPALGAVALSEDAAAQPDNASRVASAAAVSSEAFLIVPPNLDGRILSTH